MLVSKGQGLSEFTHETGARLLVTTHFFMIRWSLDEGRILLVWVGSSLETEGLSWDKDALDRGDEMDTKDKRLLDSPQSIHILLRSR